MNVIELIDLLTEQVELGHGGWPLYSSMDEEGNGYNTVTEVEIREYDDQAYLDEYGWDDDIEETNVVVLW